MATGEPAPAHVTRRQTTALQEPGSGQGPTYFGMLDTLDRGEIDQEATLVEDESEKAIVCIAPTPPATACASARRSVSGESMRRKRARALVRGRHVVGVLVES
jgi:catabolite regulation protein CreA